MLVRFDPNEPRDERGRWTTGGASSGNGEDVPVAFVSPNVSNLTFAQAEAKLNSAEQRKLAQIGGYIDGKLGMTGTTNRQAVGAWSDGAENSMMVVAPNASHDQMVAAAVMKGDLADQKAVLVFTPDASGTHHLLNFDVADKSLESVHNNLLQDGLAFHTLEDLGGGHYRVHAFVSDDAMQQAAEKAAERYDATGSSVTGNGEFIGTSLDSGSDREQRDDAHRVYNETIERLASSKSLQGYNLASIRNDVRDYWRSIAAEKALALREWDEAKHPRGQTTEGTTPGSFAPADGGGDGGGDKEVSGDKDGGNYGLVPGDVEKFHVLQEAWAKVNDESIQYQDKADSPEAMAAVAKMEAIVKEIHGLHADPGGPGGIGLPGGPRDVLIIGAGPGGLTAGIHGAAEGLDTLVVESNVIAGGQAKYSSRIENFPGFPLGISGEKLFQGMATQADRLGVETKLGVRATEMTVDKDGTKHVTLSSGEVIDARTVIIAGGAEFRKLPFKGADGPGVEYESPKKLAEIGRGGTVCVIGGSNGAAQAALGCAAGGCDHVVLLSRSEITKGMSAYVVATVRQNPKIEIMQGEIAELVRDASGNPVEVHTKSGEKFAARGVGIFAGNVPETKWVPTQVARGEGKNNNKLHTNEDLMTSIPGVFAVGDMRDRGAGRIIAAAGEGAIALRQALGVLQAQKEAAGIKADKPRDRKKPVKPPGFETTITNLADLDRDNPWFNQTIEDVPPIKKSWDAKFNPYHLPAGPGGGRFGPGGGKPGVGPGMHPGEGYSPGAWIDDKGVIHTSNVYDAQRALFENRKVELKQLKQISTLIQRLGETAAEMAEHGEEAPVFNLCNVSIAGTNLFCAEQIGIPRIDMPVIPAKQTKLFVKHLESLGYKTKKDTERADHLRATQSEIDGAKVAKSMKRIDREGFYKRLVVSSDDYILDGHHTWAAQAGVDARDGTLKGDKHVKITRVNIPIIKLIEEANKWTAEHGIAKRPVGAKGFVQLTLREAAEALDPATFRRYYDAVRQFFEANPHVECDVDNLVITVRAPPEADGSKKN